MSRLLTYSDIYTNINKYDENGSYTGLQIPSKLNQKNGQDYPLLDAIDIDWDGAWLRITNSYINTTEDLFESINKLIDLPDIQWIKNSIDGLTDTIDVILNSYVTTSSLEETLLDYQEKLIPGNYITIDENNIITTYGLLSYTEAVEMFTFQSIFDDLVQYLNKEYYTKAETSTIAYNAAVDNIRSIIIKNADPRYNDLEKISNWILQQQDYNDNFDLFNTRINRIDKVLGYVIYNTETLTYSYTDGLIKETRDLKQQTSELITKIDDLTELSYTAYDMSYNSYVIIGYHSEDSKFVELTQEDIELLNENPNAFQVYSIREDNHSGIPLPDTYYKNSTIKYYKYVDEIIGTGLSKEIEDIEDLAYTAKNSADNALYRLNTNTIGTTYAYLSLDPKNNNGSNSRTITLNVNEAEINPENGIIEQDGLITTFSLSNTISYISTFEVIGES